MATSLEFRDDCHPAALHTGTCHHSDCRFRKHPDVSTHFRPRETQAGRQLPVPALGRTWGGQRLSPPGAEAAVSAEKRWQPLLPGSRSSAASPLCKSRSHAGGGGRKASARAAGAPKPCHRRRLAWPVWRSGRGCGFPRARSTAPSSSGRSGRCGELSFFPNLHFPPLFWL